MRTTRTIAIDGTAGSGKSTLGAALASRLGYTYFDSGVVYRALTWLAHRRGIDSQDAAALAALGREMKIEVAPPTLRSAQGQAPDDGRQFTVFVDGEDATWAIRSAAVDQEVSIVSAHPDVRVVLTERLRRLAEGGGMVMVGRDIGTVVLPHADVKIYVTATLEVRARRRCHELAARGLTADYAAILADLRRRDALDGGRAAAPMRPAESALRLQTDGLTVDEEVEWVTKRIKGTRVG